jgi:hypothetical protein
MRRTLSDTLIEMALAFQPDERAALLLRLAGGSLDLPVEVRLRRSGGELELLADLPGWRWQDGFVEQPGRLRVTWQQEGAS